MGQISQPTGQAYKSADVTTRILPEYELQCLIFVVRGVGKKRIVCTILGSTAMLMDLAHVQE